MGHGWRLTGGPRPFASTRPLEKLEVPTGSPITFRHLIEPETGRTCVELIAVERVPVGVDLSSAEPFSDMLDRAGVPAPNEPVADADAEVRLIRVSRHGAGRPTPVAVVIYDELERESMGTEQRRQVASEEPARQYTGVSAHTLHVAGFVYQSKGRTWINFNGLTDAAAVPALTNLLAEVGALRRQADTRRGQPTSHGAASDAAPTGAVWPERVDIEVNGHGRRPDPAAQAEG
jgi:hypothetical protein